MRGGDCANSPPAASAARSQSGGLASSALRRESLLPLSCRTLSPIRRVMASVSISASPMFVPVGANPARVFGLDSETRACRLAAKAGLDCAVGVDGSRPAILADLGFAWDPAWLAWVAKHPGTVLMLGDRAVLAHIPHRQDPSHVRAAMESASPWQGDGLERVDSETAELSYAELRKRDRPFVLPL